ncbi:MAG: hypothetical protein SCALA702_05210 [Melioribacteraceae bacterium]|nr:MAG: hypothetical protein SCALA702_05210 [Melioribacteraceae bacterium]
MLFRVLLSILTISIILSAQENQEFRATWVVTWDHINSGLSSTQNKANVRAILDKHKQANMNAVLWHARQSGTVYYDSDIEPWGTYAGGAYPGYDPLAYAIEEAHKRGMELHAWFNVFHVASSASGTIVAEHPEWICTNEDGVAMTQYRCASPGLQEVRDYTVSVAMELVNKYDIDGIHLDFIRWNEYDEDDMSPRVPEEEQISIMDGEIINKKIKNSESPNGFKRYIYDAQHPASGGVPAGFNTWDDWRRWSVSEFVQTLHDSIQASKPWVRLSAAALGKYRSGGVNGWNGYYVVFQDAAKWFREGNLDQLTPMHYHWLTGSGFTNNLLSDWAPYIQDGIDAGYMYTVGPGSYILNDNNAWDNHPEIVNSVRTVDWTDGFQFYSYSSWNTNNYWQEAGQTFLSGKTKIRPIYDVPVIGSPEIDMVKIDSLNYEFTVTLPDSIDQNYWVAIYRSEDDNPDPQSDKIAHLAFDDSTAFFAEDFNDAVNFEGQYTYYATFFNRFWNESGVSNTVQTDQVSFMEPLPAAPDFAGAINVSDTSIVVKCAETQYAQGYAAVLSTDGVNFADTVMSETTAIEINGLQAGEYYYFKIMAYNLRGFSDAPEQLFAAAPMSSESKILVVNGFDRGTNTRNDYIREYTNPITEAGHGFSYALNESVISGDVNLTDFDIVVWILGDESTADHTFDPTEQDKVELFLENGGALFVSGAEIGWDLEGKTGHPTSADIAFYHNYLKAQYVADAPGNQSATYYTFDGIGETLFDGISEYKFDNGAHGTYDVDWPDVITPLGGAENCVSFTGAPANQNIGGVVYKGNFGTSSTPGKMVYLTVPFETIYTDSERITLMEKILDYFTEDIVSVDNGDNSIPNDYSLSQNYPNPFNPATKIKFSIPEAGIVKLSIYNILGEKVIDLVNREYAPGNYTVNFNANGLSSGVYIYRLEAKNKVISNKMILLK